MRAPLKDALRERGQLTGELYMGQAGTCMKGLFLQGGQTGGKLNFPQLVTVPKS